MSGAPLKFESPIRDAISRVRFALKSDNVLISSHFEILGEFFNDLHTSIQLLRLRGLKSKKIWAIRAQCKASCKHGKKPRHSSTRGSSIFHFRLISTCPPSIRFLAILLLQCSYIHVCEFSFRCVWGSEVNALLRDGCQLIPHIFYFNEMELNS
ncbi:hypothetical protein DVH24_025640 [Malus domestica]|uniref:Uncharacterized protein n=1 Tax=Malus domestica TaxID=3750 RepID=A0A498KJC3_MALDO|nr:hypothetical protein DVH24_025640 [Malus domestica]